MQKRKKMIARAAEPIGGLEELARAGITVGMQDHADQEQAIGIANVLAYPIADALDECQHREAVVIAEQSIQLVGRRRPLRIDIQPLLEVLDGRVEVPDGGE